MEFKHIPVMLNECIDGLNIKPDGIYVDGTIGGAGHSRHIIQKLSDKGMLIGIDRDIDALNASEKVLKDTIEKAQKSEEANSSHKVCTNYKLVQGNHDNIKEILEELKIDKVDGILLDLGVSSYQLDEIDRGFSYSKDTVLDMRMDRTQKLSAIEVVNEYSEERLADIIHEYGEERYAKNIARNICMARKTNKITTTGMLVDIIKKSKPFSKDGHPAKRTFQAIRIEVNDEIKPLYNTVMNSIYALKEGGRLCIITFHSLEDRAVKKAFQDVEGKCTCPKDLPYCICGAKSLGKAINKKPIEATKEELQYNSRSQSAKLRIFERNGQE